jgi:hypothetical protein
MKKKQQKIKTWRIYEVEKIKERIIFHHVTRRMKIPEIELNNWLKQLKKYNFLEVNNAFDEWAIQPNDYNHPPMISSIIAIIKVRNDSKEIFSDDPLNEKQAQILTKAKELFKDDDLNKAASIINAIWGLIRLNYPADNPVTLVKLFERVANKWVFQDKFVSYNLLLMPNKIFKFPLTKEELNNFIEWKYTDSLEKNKERFALAFNTIKKTLQGKIKKCP